MKRVFFGYHGTRTGALVVNEFVTMKVLRKHSVEKGLAGYHDPAMVAHGEREELHT